ncbi:hypothetical protein [Burkholderia sp. LMG 32019]
MILRQFLHPDTGGISYLFDCGGKASGVLPASSAAGPLRALDAGREAARG